jgi:hypothetical protein
MSFVEFFVSLYRISSATRAKLNCSKNFPSVTDMANNKQWNVFFSNTIHVTLARSSLFEQPS